MPAYEEPPVLPGGFLFAYGVSQVVFLKCKAIQAVLDWSVIFVRNSILSKADFCMSGVWQEIYRRIPKSRNMKHTVLWTEKLGLFGL